MATFSATITSSGATFPANPDTVIPFEARTVVLENTDGVNAALVVFGRRPQIGGSAALEAEEVEVPPGGKLRIEPFRIGELTGFGSIECEVRLRSTAGTPAVVLNAMA